MAKTFAAAGSVLVAGFGALVLLGSGRLADRLAAEGPVLTGTADETDLLAAGVGDLVRLGGLCGLPLLLLGLLLLLRVMRRDAWLDGTRLTVRGALFTTSADLALADVRIRRDVLVAHDGRPVRLPLRGLSEFERSAVLAACSRLEDGHPGEPTGGQVG